MSYADNIKVYIGERYGSLIIKNIEMNDIEKRIYLICQCDCGNLIKIRYDHFLTRKNYICNHCNERIDGIIQNTRVTHGLSSPNNYYYGLYRSYTHMVDRCTNINHPYYNDYGGRGIKICREWYDYNDTRGTKNLCKSFNIDKLMNFYNDMKDTYIPGLTLERLDINGNYSKANCIWATRKQQANNRKSNNYVIFNDTKMTLMQLSYILNINYKFLSHYIKKESIDNLFTYIDGYDVPCILGRYGPIPYSGIYFTSGDNNYINQYDYIK